jgi:hypothetical protein
MSRRGAVKPRPARSARRGSSKRYAFGQVNLNLAVRIRGRQQDIDLEMR